jgi:DNA-binding NarL/FixJ family response regulator
MPEFDRATPRSCGDSGNRSLTMLIVDDDAHAREVARRVAGMIPAVAIEGEADCGEHALEWLERGPADIVLMDWSMPGIDGVETTSRVVERHPAARVIGWTSSADRLLHARFRNAGAVDVLLKSDLIGLRHVLHRLAAQPSLAR